MSWQMPSTGDQLCVELDLAIIGIQYKDQRENVAVQHLVVMLARFTISQTIADCNKQPHVEDQFPEQWFVHVTNLGLMKDANGLYRMRDQLYVSDLAAHLGLLEDILDEAYYLRFMMHLTSVKMYHDLL